MKKPDSPPGAEGRGPCLHSDLTLLEVAEADLLRELCADRAVGALIVAKLSDCIAVAAPGSGKDLIARLRRAGHTPKIIAAK